MNNENLTNTSSNGNFSDDTSIVEEKSIENKSDRNFSDDAQIVEKISIKKDFQKNSDTNEFLNKNSDNNDDNLICNNYSNNNLSETNNHNIRDNNSDINTDYSSDYSLPEEKINLEPEFEIYDENENFGDSSSKNNKFNFVNFLTNNPKTFFVFSLIIVLIMGLLIGSLLLAPVFNKNNNEIQDPTDSSISGPTKAPVIDNNTENKGFLTYAVTENEGTALSTAEIAAKCLNSVVEIRTETVAYGQFYQEYVTEGAGSGVIITKDGYIVTNYHVIAEANSIYVTLNSGEEFQAELIGTDERSDLAVVKINEDNLIPAVVGDSDKLVVGEKAVAIGNPLGTLGGTVTDGIISALDREMTIEGQKMSLLQTNAAINPGNSGGGLFNGLGHLIAIVDAKSSGTGIEGLGFAIPSNKMSQVVNQIIEYGYVKGYVDTGISLIDITDYYTAIKYRVNELGTYVLKVYGDSALSAGFKSGDLILEVNGKEIKSSADVENAIEGLNVGDNVEFKIYRNRKTITLTMTLDEYVPEKDIVKY